MRSAQLTWSSATAVWSLGPRSVAFTSNEMARAATEISSLVLFLMKTLLKSRPAR